jgi:hypothetical protein
VTDAVHRAASSGFAFTAPLTIQVKGRTQAVQVLGVSRSPEARPTSTRADTLPQ